MPRLTSLFHPMWHLWLSRVPEAGFTCVFDVYDPQHMSTTRDSKGIPSYSRATILTDVPGRIQPIRIDSRRAAAPEPTSTRRILIQAGIEFVTEQIMPGYEIVVTDVVGPVKDITRFPIVVDESINSAESWEITIHATVDLKRML